jgi:hypothetical protein
MPTVKSDAMSLLIKPIWAALATDETHVAERLEKLPAEIDAMVYPDCGDVLAV